MSCSYLVLHRALCTPPRTKHCSTSISCIPIGLPPPSPTQLCHVLASLRRRTERDSPVLRRSSAQSCAPYDAPRSAAHGRLRTGESFTRTLDSYLFTKPWCTTTPSAMATWSNPEPRSSSDGQRPALRISDLKSASRTSSDWPMLAFPARIWPASSGQNLKPLAEASPSASHNAGAAPDYGMRKGPRGEICYGANHCTQLPAETADDEHNAPAGGDGEHNDVEIWMKHCMLGGHANCGNVEGQGCQHPPRKHDQTAGS